MSFSIFNRAFALARRGPSSSTPLLRASYGSTSANTKGKSHGGQGPTESNTGETGQTGPGSDDVAASDSAFDSNPDPKSSAKGVNKDLPQGESMSQSGANPEVSKQFDTNSSEGMAGNLSTDKSTSDGSDANTRSGRGPGKNV